MTTSRFSSAVARPNDRIAKSKFVISRHINGLSPKSRQAFLADVANTFAFPTEIREFAELQLAALGNGTPDVGGG